MFRGLLKRKGKSVIRLMTRLLHVVNMTLLSKAVSTSVMRQRMHPPRVFCAIVILFGALWVLLLRFISSHSGVNIPCPFPRQILQRTMEQQCHYPELDPKNPQILKHIKDLGPFSCNEEEDWVKIENGDVKINPELIKKGGSIKCSLTYILRINDYSSTKGKTVTLTSEEPNRALEHDYFKVTCESRKKVWKNIMAGIHRNEEAVKRAKFKTLSPRAMGLNVLMFGFDSVSRLHFIRKMPKTYDYLTNVLKATVLKGYNIVGDGTPQALIPILTGFTEPELPETRKRKPDANFVNIYPFVWKNFTENGYITAYAEDSPSTGTFTYRLKGFREMPTTHYMRTFQMEANKEFRNHPKYCLRNMPRHMVMLNWLRQVFQVYGDVPKFAFGFHGELSHDDCNLVGYADEGLYSFLEDLNKEQILNNTLLIIMSDHGLRFSSFRATQQGKQEERLPFFSIRVPPWFRLRYPNAEQNLRMNADRLTSPFDIYSTFLTLLDSNIPVVGDIHSRSISLFSEVPKERSCSDIGIEPHWCACLSWEPLPLNDSVGTEIGNVVVDFINNLTSSQRSLCAQLTFDRVMSLGKLLPNQALLTFRKSGDPDGFVGDFSDNTKVSEISYQVQIHTFPNNALYEVSVKKDLFKNVFKVRETDISRINVYGDQPRCVSDTHPHLRKYCFCKI